MKTENIVINGITGNEIVIREGAARAEFIPKPMSIAGIIDAPLRYIEKQMGSFPVHPSVATKTVYLASLTVDREAMTIVLVVDPRVKLLILSPANLTSMRILSSSVSIQVMNQPQLALLNCSR